MRLLDVTPKPFCFVNLAGLDINPGLDIGMKKWSQKNGRSQSGSWHVHYYVYPLLYWLELLTDFICLEPASFDVAYITEIDPLWQDDELTFLINPEAALFGNLIAHAACAADCVKSSTGLPFDELFWCAGCQGSMYPLNGNIQAQYGQVQGSVLAAERMIYKLHRELILWGTSGKDALCTKYPQPIIKKSQYRLQMTNPVATTSGKYACNPIGRSTNLWSAGKMIPTVGEDFGYLLWRKRNCCVL